MWYMLPRFLLIIGFMAAILHIMFRIEKLDGASSVFISQSKFAEFANYNLKQT